jgi:bacterioferritin-associated ferredoxin
VIACHCHVVSDRTILSAIADGARDIAGVGAACSAGTRCGGCHETLDLLLDAAAAVEEVFVAEPVAGVRRVREAAVR